MRAGRKTLLRNKTVSPSEAERAQSAADAEEKSLEAARMRIVQMRAQLAEIDAELAELNVVAPNDCVLEILNVKVGDVLAPNQELATLILPQHLWVRVYVPETVARIHQSGQTLSASGSIPFRG